MKIYFFKRHDLYGKLLYKFLKKKGLLQEFVQYHVNFCEKHSRPFPKLTTKHNVFDFFVGQRLGISLAFSWDETHEGYKFWSLLDNEFSMYFHSWLKTINQMGMAVN